MAGKTEARGVISLFDGSASNTTTIQSQPCLLEVMLCCLGYLHRQRFFVIGKATTCTPNCKSNGGGWGGWWVCKGQGFDTGDPRTNRIYRRQGGFEWLMTLGHTCLFTLSGVAMAKQHGGQKKKSARLTIVCWKLEISYDPETTWIVGRHQLVEFLKLLVRIIMYSSMCSMLKCTVQLGWPLYCTCTQVKALSGLLSSFLPLATPKS